MRYVRAVLIAFGVLAVLYLVVIGLFFFESHRPVQQNYAPAAGVQTASAASGIVISSETHGDSSFLVREASATRPRARLTSAPSGIESEASLSRDGRLVTYSFAATPISKSAIWVVGADGTNPHALTSPDEDALHPVFSPDGTVVFYAASRWTGHHSPIAAPSRHDWDIFSRSVQAGASAPPQQVTGESFYEVRSLDAVADGVRPGKVKLLLSTSAYPIGDLFREIIPGTTEGRAIFQPHVPNAPALVSPSFGEARFTDDGMTIVFLAASEQQGSSNYDYNVYSMSDVTGSELKQVTHVTGISSDLRIISPGTVSFVNAGSVHTAKLTQQTR